MHEHCRTCLNFAAVLQLAGAACGALAQGTVRNRMYDWSVLESRRQLPVCEEAQDGFFCTACVKCDSATGTMALLSPGGPMWPVRCTVCMHAYMANMNRCERHPR
ncbi:hypothetical protein COCOBI_03-7370 [Coccomyxa sp. Obi]|nr:hypothetical protein COCOBI_03-7370 [Coccomyxa sp. Obi]